MLLKRSAYGILCFSALIWAAGPQAANAGHGHFSHGSHGSSGGSYGSHGSSGGSHGSSGGSHGSSGGSHGSSGGSHGSSGGGTTVEEAPAPPQAYYRMPRRGVGRLVVRVPAKSKVYLQDQPMTLNGTVRRFVSPPLNRNIDYVYRVKVEIERNGEMITKTTTAKIRAGQQVEVSVDFDKNDENQLVANVSQPTGR